MKSFPSTLGIDVKKLDNAEAQREKEKTTLYTRNKIVDQLKNIIPQIVDVTFKFADSVAKKPVSDTNATVNFGGYANPSFEATVETVGKAASAQIMSVEAQVEELWGEDKDAKWKKQEIRRIKAEKGIVSEADEPAVSNSVTIGF